MDQILQNVEPAPDPWLDDPRNDSLRAIKIAVREIHEENLTTHPDLPFFTPHDIGHYDRVSELLHQLIPFDKVGSLTTLERYYLLASAYVHDLGMLGSVVERVHGKPLPDPFRIRKIHHLTSEKYIVEQWRRLKIAEEDKDVIASISRYHRRAEDIGGCCPIATVHYQKVRQRLLACYLRLADALDISVSRTPAASYVACLAYRMPEDSKLHWVKSRLVNGLLIEPETRQIRVQFKTPSTPANLRVDESAKLEFIRKQVIEDLQDELHSVSTVLTREGPTFFLDVIPYEYPVVFDARMSNDIRDLLANYDTMSAPSSSKLLEMILVGAANILGYSLSLHGAPVALDDNGAPVQEVKARLEEFRDTIAGNVLGHRRCHSALRTLVKDISQYCHDLEHGEVEDVARRVNLRFQNHHASRSRVRRTTKRLFTEQLSPPATDHPCSILLYGYSELVTKALCGLRDSTVASLHPGLDSTMVRDSAIEKEASHLLRIFICEGQAKTQTEYHDRILYHDGAQYALHLRRHGFGDITVIPDITAGTVIAKAPIDYVFVGANGVSEDCFLHSAGHYTILQLASIRRADDSRPVTVLVASAEKLEASGSREVEPEPLPQWREKDAPTDFLFADLPGFGANRHNIWMSRDAGMLKSLRDEGIRFLNPREDRIPFDMVDYVVTEEKWTTGSAVLKGRESPGGPEAAPADQQEFHDRG